MASDTAHRHQTAQPHRHRRPRGHRVARHAARRRHGRRRLGEAPDRRGVELERDHPLQPVARPAGQGRQDRRAQRRRLPARVRHDLGVRRHLDGPRGHALLAGEPRDHRRLGRDRHDGRAPRRIGAARRLRQEPAGHADGRRAPRPGQRVPLRRVDHAGQRRRQGRHDHRRLRGRRCLHQGTHHARRGRQDRTRHLPGRRRLRWHVHRQHDGHRRGGARHEPARDRPHRRRSTAAATSSPSPRARPSSSCCARASRPARS